MQPIEREAPQAAAQVAPGVEVPIAAVVHEALRREPALGVLVTRAAVVEHAEPVTFDHRTSDLAEGVEIDDARRAGEDADAARELGATGRVVACERFDAFA